MAAVFLFPNLYDLFGADMSKQEMVRTYENTKIVVLYDSNFVGTVSRLGKEMWSMDHWSGRAFLEKIWVNLCTK